MRLTEISVLLQLQIFNFLIFFFLIFPYEGTENLPETWPHESCAIFLLVMLFQEVEYVLFSWPCFPLDV